MCASQAELKRVYTQLEVLKTKVMRRDNPHISKRRGGRKPGHRKFSLQAFHNRHSSSSEHHNPAPSGGGNAAPGLQGAGASACQSGGGGEQVGLLAAAAAASRQQAPGVQPYPSVSAGGSRLPALAELDGETPSSYNGQRVPLSALAKQRGASGSGAGLLGGGGSGVSSIKHVRVDDTIREYAGAKGKESAKLAHEANRRRGHSVGGGAGDDDGGSQRGLSLTSKLFARASSGKKNKKQQQQNSARPKWTPELPSTSSLCLDDEAIMAMNDSQSSGEVTPQQRSSIVYGNSSYQTDEPTSSVN